jgi:hypothetical protein
MLLLQVGADEEDGNEFVAVAGRDQGYDSAIKASK